MVNNPWSAPPTKLNVRLLLSASVAVIVPTVVVFSATEKLKLLVMVGGVLTSSLSIVNISSSLGTDADPETLVSLTPNVSSPSIS